MRRSIISEEEKKFILERHRSYGYNSIYNDSNDEDSIEFEVTENKSDSSIEDLKKEIERLDKEIADKKEKLNNIRKEIDSKLKKSEQNEDTFTDLLNADSDLEMDRDSLEQS